MLQRLSIRDFALIRELDLDPGRGLIILSGETGAGKSVFLDSLHLLCGRRASRELVRRGSARARVEACFDDAVALLPAELLDELSLPEDERESGELILSREIEADGRSYARLNGRLISLGLLRTLSSYLFALHAQHEEVSLYENGVQRSLLDRFAGAPAAAALKRWQRLRQHRLEGLRLLKSLGIRPEERERRLDLLRFQIGEIREAAFQTGEAEELKQRFRENAALSRVREELALALRALNPEEGTAADQLLFAANQLRYSADHRDELASLRERLYRCAEEADALGAELASAAEKTGGSEEEQQRLVERLELWQRLSSKYGKTEEEQARFLAGAEAEEEALTKGEAAFLKKREELLQEEAEAEKAALSLRAIREKAAAELSRQIEENLRALNMPAARFRIELRPLPPGDSAYWGESGRDEIEFMISPNAGEELMPLRRIASGGEASRVLLAIKSILAEEDAIPVLVFDEIDAGVSGETAARLGEKLLALARGRQILAVTHTAQIAALADQHLHVYKAFAEGRTETKLRLLKGEERLAELSRLLAGDEEENQARELARTLLARREGQS